MDHNATTPINKGNYSMDTKERELAFHSKLGSDWPEGYREYRKNWSLLAKNHIVSDYPLLVDIELSSICNLRCPMCYTITEEFKSKVNTKLMDYDLFTKIIDQISDHVPAIRLSYRGESLLHPYFIDCIKYAKARGICEVSTLTNGAKLDLSMYQKLHSAGLDWITMSVDGTGKTYESIRGPVKFDTIIQNLTDIANYRASNNVLKPVIKIQGIWPAIAENPQNYYDTFKDISDLVAFNPLIDYLSNDTEIDYVEDFVCPQQYQRLVIGADGVVMKCSNDEENTEIIDDANISTIYDIWHGKNLSCERTMQLQKHGFKQSDVCKKCYLPRATKDELVELSHGTISIPNYTKRSQQVGS